LAHPSNGGGQNMRFTTRARYGLRFLIDLALNSADGPVRLKEIAMRQGISKKYLERIVSILSASGFIRSVRGSKGGFMLAKPIEQISVLDAIEALDGKINVVKCILMPKVCKRTSECIARKLWMKLNEAIRQALKDVTLKDLVGEAKRKRGDRSKVSKSGRRC